MFYSEGSRRLSVDGNCVEIYRTTCDHDNVAPQAAIERGLRVQEINVRYRYLGDQDAHALSSALCVRIDRPHTLIDHFFHFVSLLCKSVSVKQYASASVD